MSETNYQPIFLLGPTAVGKSAVALELAEQVGGEIISVDSMQVYRGLDIGTAKPSVADRARVPHHLIDVVELTEPFDAASFERLAHQAVLEIQARGHVPIFCGGTGLYFKAFFSGVGTAPPADLSLRAALDQLSLPELLDELERKDPVLAARIDRHNRRRVVRAIEVIRLTGRPFSEQRADWQAAGLQGKAHPPRALFGFSRSSEDLRERIDQRVDWMFAQGLVAETERLLANGVANNRVAMQAIGYRQVFEHLRRERSLAETIELVKQKTRQFAKRQITWFRHQFQVEWMALDRFAKAESVAKQIAERCGL